MPENPTSHSTTDDFQVLIVDDEALICWSLENIMRQAGFQAFTAANAEDAIRMLKQEHYDMVITDLQLPQGDGFSVLKEAQKQFPPTPVVIMSAYGSPQNKERAQKVGAKCFLDKPISVPELLDCARKLQSQTKH